MSNGVTIYKLEITIWYIFCIYFYDSWNFKIYTWIVVYRFISKIFMYMHIANKTNIISIITVCKRYRLIKPINLASLSTETTCIFSSFFVNLACQGCQLLVFFFFEITSNWWSICDICNNFSSLLFKFCIEEYIYL